MQMHIVPDGGNPNPAHLCLTVVTAAADYPQDIGWVKLQRGTQYGGTWWNVSSDNAPRTSRGEPSEFQAVMRKGDTLIFTSTTKHAATPNPTNVARRLVHKVTESRGPAPSNVPPPPRHLDWRVPRVRKMRLPAL